MDLKTVLESMANRTEPAKSDELSGLVESGITKLFWSNLPFYSADKLKEIKRKILNHYLFREIAVTPVAQWQYRLNVKLTEILPYYSEMMETTELEYNPLLDVDYTEEVTGEESGTGSASTTKMNKLLGDYTQDDYREGDQSGSGQDTTDTRGSSTAKEKGSSEDTGESTRTDDLRKNGQNDVVHELGAVTEVSGVTTNTANNTPTAYLDAFLADKYMTSADRTSGSNTTTLGGKNADRGNYNETNAGTVENTSHETGSTTRDVDTTSTGHSGTVSNSETHSEETFTGNRHEDRREDGSEDTQTSSNKDSRQTRKVKGKRGGQSYASIVKEYRENILNIELMIVEELEDLFFMVY